ncbi:hypothetical protein AALO_G00225340 [Alosa alosa]|uniref:Uncharacterized protein n=1 Tax=Alosa alosa TaxID=278164 RepID=A0AAV6G2R0_9TELE|nr:hypothetical protein AALO_G00225340 [Alosa alosa]
MGAGEAVAETGQQRCPNHRNRPLGCFRVGSAVSSVRASAEPAGGSPGSRVGVRSAGPRPFCRGCVPLPCQPPSGRAEPGSGRPGSVEAADRPEGHGPSACPEPAGRGTAPLSTGPGVSVTQGRILHPVTCKALQHCLQDQIHLQHW